MSASIDIDEIFDQDRDHGGRTRFYGHIDTSGDDLMMKARAIIAREIADGLWC
ncbi:hypothetical protein QEZ48_16745 [Aquamicrobium lusatiense]|uniref:hypothetical protein n=1 Tax=Aquamicrobium lusatiense TaxID=89772 RepID=UPI002455091C|nr:hypothetical protein [Aquamicrobium lusatiense]MDH4992458.1 hypothetical protein [Aquamicrobium lusatiense]